MSRLKINLAWVQGIYFAATGLWPLLDIRSFQQVTGKKTDHLVTGLEADHWLVNTVAVLVLSIAAALLVAALRRNVTPEILVLALSAAAGLLAIDVIYVARGTILPIYLVDAAAQLLFIAAWGMAVLRRRSSPS